MRLQRKNLFLLFKASFKVTGYKILNRKQLHKEIKNKSIGKNNIIFIHDENNGSEVSRRHCRVPDDG